MKLKAIHAIYRKEGSKQVRHEPGSEFACPDAEAEGYVATGAALAVEDAVPAKKAPAKKAAKKDDAPKADAKADAKTDGEGTDAKGDGDGGLLDD